MTIKTQPPAGTRLMMSGNEAVARAAWESGLALASAYPGTPSTEILEELTQYPDLNAQWAVNEKVALEVAIGAAVAGSRSMAAMKQVGVNVAADPLMSQSLAGVVGGLVLVVADDVGLSSSQNEQDTRFWGRFAHIPVIEPADAQEAYEMMKQAFELSEKFETIVILRMTTRVCHVKSLVTVGERRAKNSEGGFTYDPNRWVLVPSTAKRRLPIQAEREKALKAESEKSPLNFVEPGSDKRLGFVTSGPGYLHVKETFPDAPVMKLGLSHPAPFEAIRAFAGTVERLVVVEETEKILETELKAEGIGCTGKDILPSNGELAPEILAPAIAKLLGEPVPVRKVTHDAATLFPRPPTMCVGCPHLGVYYTLSRLRRQVTISGDIGCYTLGALHPWKALDTTTCMGASMTMALGLDKGRLPKDADKSVVAVIGDSTFLHMGIQGLLNLVYNKGNATVLILDNHTVGMTGGQDHPGTGKDAYGMPAPKVDFMKLVEALGVKPERIHKVNPYMMPLLFKTLKDEMAIPEVSVIITDQPCVLIEDHERFAPFTVVEADCTGCGNCLKTGCPAILVRKREKLVKNGKEQELAFVDIDISGCTGCGLCTETCGPDAIKRMIPKAAKEVQAHG
ncbi:MAG: thiamine pyrophosphate-dependent enzyme [Rhodospirillales bacterium]